MTKGPIVIREGGFVMTKRRIVIINGGFMITMRRIVIKERGFVMTKGRIVIRKGGSVMTKGRVVIRADHPMMTNGRVVRYGCGRVMWKPPGHAERTAAGVGRAALTDGTAASHPGCASVRGAGLFSLPGHGAHRSGRRGADLNNR